MKPTIKRIFSSDIDDLINFIPCDIEDFEIAISLDLGSVDNEGADIFQVSVITPKWLATKCKNCKIYIPRHCLIIAKYDYQEILKAINEICSLCEGSDWDECSEKLSRYFLWEFEDYNK